MSVEPLFGSLMRPSWLGLSSSNSNHYTASVLFLAKRRPFLLVALTISFLWLVFHHRDDVQTFVLDATAQLTQEVHFDDVYNSTLGFHKVYTIGMKERTDKKDLSTLAASFVGFDIEWLPGVSYKDVSSKAAPATWDFEKNSPGALGCWRAHMNALQHMVENRIQSALIMEDDSDWAIFLKEQLFEMSTGTRALQNSSRHALSPYGDDWDLLWLGHCRAGPGGHQQDMWVVDDDFTVPPTNHRWAKWRHSRLIDETQRNDTRLVFHATAGMCMYGYAISFEGARKMLNAVAIQPRNQPVDVSLSAMCRGRFAKPFTCYGVYPPLISSHRQEGSRFKDSDLNHKSKSKAGWHPEHTWDILYSTMMNLPRLVEGAETVKAQWPDDVELREAPVDGKSRPPARGYLKNFDFPALPEKPTVEPFTSPPEANPIII